MQIGRETAACMCLRASTMLQQSGARSNDSFSSFRLVSFGTSGSTHTAALAVLTRQVAMKV